METEACCESRQMKHLGLDEAIDSLRVLVNRVDFIINRATKSGVEDMTNKTKAGGEACTPQPPQPTLMEILDTGGNRIYETKDEVMSRLHDLESILF